MRPVKILLPVISLIYFALFTLVTIFVASLPASVDALFAIYTAVALIAAFVVWRETRIGYLVGAVASALIIVTLSFAPKPNGILDVLSNPADTGEFVNRITTFPLLLASLAYSILGLREKWTKHSMAPKTEIPARTIPQTSVITTLAIGFIMGGLVIGLLAGATMSGLLANSGVAADITIVQGAASSSNGQFYSPANFTTSVGKTVTWVNRDTASHTVTSNNGLFDSGNLVGAATYKHSFTQPGTFQYECTYHAWMKGFIIVTP